MATAVEIWAVTECDGEHLRDVTLEILGDAREQADRVRGGVAAVVLGPLTGAAQAQLARFGADRILHADGSAAEARSAERCAGVLAGALDGHTPHLVLFGATTLGGDVASRLAASKRLAFASNCNWTRIGPDGSVEAARLVYGGKLYARVRLESRPALASIQVGAAGVGRPAPRQPRVDALPPLSGVPARVEHLGMRPADPRTVDISEAERIVAVGRGIGSHERLALFQKLADMLGASLASSRPLVDAGWVEFERQVGQTGRVVSPRLYLAAGISGASHHTLGMKTSECVIAINRDKNAEIFKLADLKVAADLEPLVPALLAHLEKQVA